LEWLPLIVGGVGGLSFLAFAWWNTRAIRKDAKAYLKLQRQLSATQRMVTDGNIKLIDEQQKRFDETVTLTHMLEGRDRELAALRRYVEEIDELLASGACNDLALARLRRELSEAEAPDDDLDRDPLPN